MKFTTTTSLKLLSSLFFIVWTIVLPAQVKTANTPNWVKKQDYKTTIDISLDEVEYGYVVLLSDEQIQVPKQERFIRVVKKITDNLGIQDAAEIADSYDPKYQSITFHNINVIRNGEVINKLDVNNFQVIRRESNSESYIYDGRLTAMINLSDIRKDDILDYSYTITGFNPIHKGSFSGIFSINGYVYMNKSNVRLLSNDILDYRLFNSDLKPAISNINGLKDYQWLSENVKRIDFDNETPIWLIEHQYLIISSYKSWKNVIDWGINMYEVNNKMSSKLKYKIDAISTNYLIENERIVATLEFVQNEIRYLGLEEGIGSYKPFSPNLVFEQRFGDCKDKTLLMVTMLKEMGIEAYPMLVSSTFGKNLPKILPSPKVFDHVVVKVITKTGHEIYYDPTITNQKGKFDKIYFPNYEYGLVIKKDVEELEKIQNFSDNLIEVVDDFILDEVGKGASLKIKTIYYEYEADKIRNYYKNNSLTNIKKNFKTYYSNYYEKIEVVEDPIIKDDSTSNKITIYEHYKLEDIWEETSTDGDNIGVTFTPTSINDILLIPTEQSKTKEFALYYPTSKRHTINVKLPEAWNLSPKDYNIYSKDFYYEFEGSYNNSRQELNLMSYYKNQSDHVSPENYKQYYKDINDLESRLSYYIYVPKNSVASYSFINKDSTNSEELTTNIIKNLLLFLVLPVIVIFIILLIVVIVQRNSKT